MKMLRFVLAYFAILVLFCPRSFSQGCDQGLVITFKSNKHDLLATEKKKLDELGSQLAEMTDVYIEVYGNTDPKGSEEFNFELADKRIKEVSSYLRKTVKGKDLDMKEFNFGETKLLYKEGDDEALQAKNRRVEVHVFPLVEGKISLAQKSGTTVRIDKTYFAGCGVCGPRLAITEALTAEDAAASGAPLTDKGGDWMMAGMIRLQTECPELVNACANAEISIPAEFDKDLVVLHAGGQGEDFKWTASGEKLTYSAETHEYKFTTDLCNNTWISIGKPINREDIIELKLPALARNDSPMVYISQDQPDGEPAAVPLQFTASLEGGFITQCLACKPNLVLTDSGVAENGFTYYYTGSMEPGFTGAEKRVSHYELTLKNYTPVIRYSDSVVVLKMPKQYANKVKLYLPGLDSSLAMRHFEKSENRFRMKKPQHTYSITFQKSKSEKYSIPGEALRIKYKKKKNYYQAKIRKRDLQMARL